MKKQINRNNIWTEAFVNQLVYCGIKNVCLSPGSRNTPLTLAFAKQKKIKKFIILDERSSAFFALGLAKQTGKPTAIVTTSGTAIAELYPAILEAFNTKTPMIICTADRPPELHNCGTNQTVNQQNIYSPNIKYFIDAGLPELTTGKINFLKQTAVKLYNLSAYKSPGPVHINFPFRKPLEPSAITDTIETSKINEFLSHRNFLSVNSKTSTINKKIFNTIIKNEKGIIYCGGGTTDKIFTKLLIQLSMKLNYPIVADGTSSIRFGKFNKTNIISNASAFLSSKKFNLKFSPELILQFGYAPTSNVLLEFFKNTKSKKIAVNKLGELHDPSRTTEKIIKTEPVNFLKEFLSTIDAEKIKFTNNKRWLKIFQNAEKISESVKQNFLQKADFPFEGKVITELLKSLPNKANLIIANSTPVRDFDLFTAPSNKKINLIFNRGVSGIDGIISTAAGVSASLKTPTFLVTGDLSFFHDLNGLHTVVNNSLNLNIVLINNNGGGIFRMMPVSNTLKHKYFNKYFITPHNIDFAFAIKAFGGNYFKIKSWNELDKQLSGTAKLRGLNIFEIFSDSEKSFKIRKSYKEMIIKAIDKLTDEY